MAINEELEQILKNSARDLPDDPSQSGWSTKQIKEKMYAFIPMLYDLIVTERSRITDLEEDGVGELGETVQAILSGTTPVGKALKDGDGNNIKLTYAKIEEILNGSLAVLKYLKEDGTSTEFVYKIEKDLATLSTTYANFLTNCFNGNKVKNSENADYSEKAYRDDLGNVIKNTYATITSLNQTLNEVTKIKNGTTIVAKAQRDANNDIIHTTYLKIANIINDLTHTDTNKALSANMGKVLLARIVAIETLLESDDTSLDELQEIVTYIKNNKSLIDGITANKVSVSDIITDYNSNVSTKPVSASVAYALKGLIDAIVSGVTKVKNAENADKLDNHNASEFVRSINGIDPTSGNVNVAGFVSFVTFEDGNDLKLKAIYQGDIGGTFSLQDVGDYKYVVFTPTPAE